ncbi:MAG: DUF3330 domain-containing protein [Sulfuricella sp.]|nr:DUF3330 domain-containing protein [Sulfuricella sp.]
MSDKNVDMNAPHEMVLCKICLTEIPATVAKTFDGHAYVHYFCGLDCLGIWQEQLEKAGEGESHTDPL